MTSNIYDCETESFSTDLSETESEDFVSPDEKSRDKDLVTPDGATLAEAEVKESKSISVTDPNNVKCPANPVTDIGNTAECMAKITKLPEAAGDEKVPEGVSMCGDKVNFENEITDKLAKISTKGDQQKKLDPHNAKDLHEKSREYKKLDALIFDFGENKVEARILRFGLVKWLNSHLPTKYRVSLDRCRKIYVISPLRTEDELEYFLNPLSLDEKALEEWNGFLTKDKKILTHETIKNLAEKHRLLGGKWIMHVKAMYINDVWKKVAWLLAYNKFPPNVKAVSVTPNYDDSESDLHLISLWNTDFCDKETIFKAEEVLRDNRVGFCLNYKPDIYSAIGVYRGNEWNLRPSIFSSKYIREEDSHSITNQWDSSWKYEVHEEGDVEK